jgi:adenylosuccinate lyase
MVMARLGLGVADISWHPARDRFVEYVGVLGLVGGSLAKIAGEIVSLAHNEIDELAGRQVYAEADRRLDRDGFPQA